MSSEQVVHENTAKVCPTADEILSITTLEVLLLNPLTYFVTESQLAESVVFHLPAQVFSATPHSCCAEDLLQFVEHMLLHCVVFSFSQDLRLRMCLRRQSQVRLTAKISLHHRSDLGL